MNRFVIGLASAVLLACSGSSSSEGDDAFDSAEYLLPISSPVTQELVTATGKKWLVHQTPLTDPAYVGVSVETKGFARDQQALDLGEIDPVIQVRLADLDKDGFEELYLVTQSKGRESYGTVYGFYSDADKDVLLISFEGASPYTTKEGGPFEGYQGGDVFLFNENQLMDSFDAQLPQFASPVKKKVYYKLVKEEGAIVLRPDRWVAGE
ncbi:MAG: hypothetical protein JNN04_16975 [Cyclobacteriaceae bacterium]|nr:hypothetical protein [Cyclobacteriaceae bacterium]